MSYRPFEAQIRAHRAFLYDNYKRGLLYWSRRTGKTLWSIQHLMLSCMLNQGPHHIIFKEYQQAESVAWNQYLHTIPEALINKNGLNKQTLTITFNYMGNPQQGPTTIKLYKDQPPLEVMHDQSKPPSSIRLLGSDRADQHRGGESMGMILDEYQDQDQYGWDFVYQPMLLTTDGWACFMGTAKDTDAWNEMLDRAETRYKENPKGFLPSSTDENEPVNRRWYFQKATWRENPIIKPEVIARLRREAEEDGKLGAFLQEHELIPFTQQGAVYPMFVRKLHIISQDDVPKDGTDYLYIDFGFTEGHPMAIGFIRITRDDIWYQWDEIHGVGIQLDDAIAEIKVKMGDRRIAGIVADSARPDLIDYMASKGLPVIPSPKKQNSIISGIELLRVRLKPKIQIIGEPKPGYFVTSNCRKTIHDWTHYRYREIKQNRSAQEIPEKKFDDAMDGLRYLALFFKFGKEKNEKMPESELSKASNQYGLL